MGVLDSVAAWLDDALTPGHWVTLKNGKRLKLDDDGRIVLGLPERYHGTHIRDLAQLSHDERQLEGIDCAESGHCHTCKKTFRTKDEAAAAILAANPEFSKLRDSEFGDYDAAFLKWQRGGRRGPKPRTAITDGRLDAINEYFELRGAARVGSFTEALYFTIPASKRWEDLDDERLRPLSEAAGFQLQPPEETIRLQVAGLSVDECRDDVDRRLGELFDRAKAGRLGAADVDVDDAPF